MELFLIFAIPVVHLGPGKTVGTPPPCNFKLTLPLRITIVQGSIGSLLFVSIVSYPSHSGLSSGHSVERRTLAKLSQDALVFKPTFASHLAANSHGGPPQLACRPGTNTDVEEGGGKVGGRRQEMDSIRK